MAGPSLWNNLSLTIREDGTSGTLAKFKSVLKTHLFRIAFETLVVTSLLSKILTFYFLVKLTFMCDFNNCSIIIYLIQLVYIHFILLNY